MTNKNCLNCEKELMGDYCFGCGQKADTHRITFKNFIFHDLLHGTFHIEKGMLFTAKQALIRPGKAALDYISGKRNRYYNVFYFILLTIGVMLFIRHFYGELDINQSGVLVQEPSGLNEASKKMDEIFSHKSKFILLLFVPFAALNSFLLFKRKKLNLSEHFIVSGMVLLGILLIATLWHVLFYVHIIADFSDYIYSLLLTVVIILYVGYAYFNAFGADYSKLGIAYRIVLFFALICSEVLILLFILIGFVTNWKFGQITISPFG